MMRLLIATTVTLLALSACNYANAEMNNTAIVSDVNKEVINRQPYQVEVCTDRTVRNDTTGDMIVGGIIGGIIGNQIGKGGGKNAATGIGALTGAIIANDKNANASTKRVCSIETRYNEQRQTVYSHSIVTFWNNGKQYTLRFQK